MLLPARRLTPMSAIAFTIYGAIVIRPSVCVKSSLEGSKRVLGTYYSPPRCHAASSSSQLSTHIVAATSVPALAGGATGGGIAFQFGVFISSRLLTKKSQSLRSPYGALAP